MKLSVTVQIFNRNFINIPKGNESYWNTKIADGIIWQPQSRRFHSTVKYHFFVHCQQVMHLNFFGFREGTFCKHLYKVCEH